MEQFASMINLFSILATVFTVIGILGVAALGLRKSWKRSLITLCRNVAAALLAFITAKLLTPTISSLVGELIGGELGAEFEEMPTLFGFVTGIPGAVLMPFLFVILFWVFSLILLIPQIFVKKAVLKDEIEAKKQKKKPEIPWKSRFISAGIKLASAVIVVLIVMLPLSCLLAVVNDVYPVIGGAMANTEEDTDYSEDYDNTEEVDVYEDILSPIVNNPVIVCASNPVSRAIYSNLTEIRVGDTVCYLEKEITDICGVIGNFSALTNTEPADFGEDQKTAIKGITSYVADSDFRCTLICEVMATMDTGESGEGDAFSSVLMNIFTKATPETLSDDLTALGDVFGVLIDNGIFALLSEENAEADPDAMINKLSDKAFIESLLKAVNPSQNCRNLLPTVFSLALEELEEDVSINTNVPELSDEQISAEATAISDTLKALLDISDVESGGDSLDGISNLNATAFGALYDNSQKSIILKDSFKVIFISVLDSSDGLGDLAAVLKDHIENDPNLNMTKVLTAVQQLAKIFSRYEEGNSTTDLVALEKELDALINSVDENTAEVLHEMLETDAFSSAISDGADEKTTKLLSSVINSMIDMEDLTEDELKQEAKAIDYLLKISNAKSESVDSVFDAETDNADDMMETILNSNISSSAITELAYDEEGNLTEDALDLSESLTDEDKEDVRTSAENYYKENSGDMSAEEKELLKKNMNAIAAVFGNDLTNDFDDWDAEIAN